MFLALFENLKLEVKQFYQTGQFATFYYEFQTLCDKYSCSFFGSTNNISTSYNEALQRVKYNKKFSLEKF